MNEVEKMRSSQLADMSAPEVQVKFEYAKKLLARMRQLSTYDEAYRGLLEDLIPGIPETSVVCPPFHCDHWDGIRLGEHVCADLYSTTSDGLCRTSYSEGICLSGDDRIGLLDWRWCCYLSRRNNW